MRKIKKEPPPGFSLSMKGGIGSILVSAFTLILFTFLFVFRQFSFRQKKFLLLINQKLPLSGDVSGNAGVLK